MKDSKFAQNTAALHNFDKDRFKALVVKAFTPPADLVGKHLQFPREFHANA
jgi:hypothetical protein